MKISRLQAFFLFLFIAFTTGCANIVPPEGGKKDVTPPKLLAITPGDSLLNTRVTRIEMRFDEFITLNNPASEVQVSPLLPLPVTVTNIGRRVIVTIPDTLLLDSTTYRVSFGNAIQDLRENNPFTGYTYVFSTGSFFDSLRLDGFVLNAATGLPDTNVNILLYSASKSDSVVVREKPLYTIKTSPGGTFSLEGLPNRLFRIYALKDANNNLIYDGGEESIAFIDSIVRPADSITSPIILRLFKEPATDTIAADTTIAAPGKRSSLRASRPPAEGFVYNVAVDTTDTEKRSQDITKPLIITFNKPVDSINSERVHLSYDSVGITVESFFSFEMDSVKEELLYVNTNWKENTVYTLRLLKGFAKDTGMTDAMPSRHTFRTRSEDDYAKLHIHLPAKYNHPKYILMVTTDADTVYQKPVADTMVHLYRLAPASYSVRLIVDENRNGQWDTGNLFEKKQPEEVIPYTNTIQLKAGWENTIDFEPEKRGRAGATSSSPGKRDKP